MLKTMKRLKFTASKPLLGSHERSHYNGARMFLNLTSDEEEIKEKIDELQVRYPEIIKFLKETSGMLTGKEGKELKKHIKNFTLDRFNEIIDLAKKDHADNFGVREIRSWRRT